MLPRRDEPRPAGPSTREAANPAPRPRTSWGKRGTIDAGPGRHGPPALIPPPAAPPLATEPPGEGSATPLRDCRDGPAARADPEGPAPDDALRVRRTPLRQRPVPASVQTPECRS